MPTEISMSQNLVNKQREKTRTDIVLNLNYLRELWRIFSNLFVLQHRQKQLNHLYIRGWYRSVNDYIVGRLSFYNVVITKTLDENMKAFFCEIRCLNVINVMQVILFRLNAFKEFQQLLKLMCKCSVFVHHLKVLINFNVKITLESKKDDHRLDFIEFL